MPRVHDLDHGVARDAIALTEWEERVGDLRARGVEKVDDVAALDYPPGLDERRGVADTFHDLHFVRDEEHGQPELCVEVFHQLQDGIRGFWIERAGRFVREQHLRVTRERSGDAHPLLLTAGKL